MQWRKNNISKRYLNYFTKSGNKWDLILLFIAILFPLILFFIYKQDVFKLIFFEIFGILLVLMTHFKMKSTILSYPKYIQWNENGIYIINHKNKKQFTPWNDIRYIKKLKKLDPKVSYAEDYIVERKHIWDAQYLLDPKIGEEVYYEWLKYKE